MSSLRASLAGTASVILTPIAWYASLFAALLDGAGFSYLPECGSPTLSFQSVVDAAATLSLTILGFGGDPLTCIQTRGSYAGSIRVENIAGQLPEPQTYALLLLGFGVLGAARRLKRQVG